MTGFFQDGFPGFPGSFRFYVFLGARKRYTWLDWFWDVFLFKCFCFILLSFFVFEEVFPSHCKTPVRWFESLACLLMIFVVQIFVSTTRSYDDLITALCSKPYFLHIV